MNTEIILPSGAMGASPDDDILDRMLRTLATKASTDPDEWCDKYGTRFENDVFMMHPYCWCEKKDCPWCAVGMPFKIANQKNCGPAAPNFHHKPSGFKVWWYKYIGRGVTMEPELSPEKILVVGQECLGSLD